MTMIALEIDGRPVSVPLESTILEAAKKIGVKIPTFRFGAEGAYDGKKDSPEH